MSHTDFEIGEVNSPDELEATFQLEKSVFGPFGTDNPPEIIKLQQQTYPDGFIVARVGGAIVGYCSSEKWNDFRSPKMGEDPRETHSQEGRVFCITTMVVRDDLRGLGIGTAMLEYL
ncbi:MAG: GNAT family N-acetyltransferase, partial [Bdellovibrionales bacterium]|nr:GNAT family N-acetyltransferase [Bdellovibrionales bacterium]